MGLSDGVLDTVRRIVADVLALEVDEVQPSHRFFNDLGGESLEILETSFQCEKAFGIRLALHKALSETDLEVDAEGVLTPRAWSNLRQAHPFLEFDRIADRSVASRLYELLTVQAIAHFVERAILARDAAAADSAATPGHLSLGDTAMTP